MAFSYGIGTVVVACDHSMNDAVVYVDGERVKTIPEGVLQAREITDAAIAEIGEFVRSRFGALMGRDDLINVASRVWKTPEDHTPQVTVVAGAYSRDIHDHDTSRPINGK
jgi:hypothetical protein